MAEIPKINVTIDGIPLEVEKGTLLTEAARQAGINIPVFCSHAKLLPLGACRMCLVELEKAPKLVTACTTEVSNKMVVFTQTPRVKRARSAIMQFFLANHPLDCPICDEGGECELQNNAFEHGAGDSKFAECKRDYDRTHGRLKLSPLISWVSNRCVHCERCTRICREVVGDDHLGMLMRGENSMVSTFNFSQMTCELCGNCAEYCPTGTITNGAVKYKERVWNLKPTESFCSLCSSICSMSIWTNQKKLIARVTAKHNSNGDQAFLCVKGRYSFDADQTEVRLKDAEKKLPHGRERVPSAQVVSTICEAFSAISAEGSSTAVIYNSSLSNEEAYILGRLARRNLKASNIIPLGNHEGLATYLDRFFGKQANQSDLLDGDLLLFIDAPVARETPVIGYLATRASRQRGAALFTVGPEMTKHSRMALSHIWNPPHRATEFIEALLKKLSDSQANNPQASSTDFDKLAEALRGARRPVLIAGSRPMIEGGAFVNAIDALSKKLSSAQVLFVPSGRNTIGTFLMAGSGSRAPGWQNVVASNEELPSWLSQIELNGVSYPEDLLLKIESGAIRHLVLAGEDIFDDFQNLPRWLKAFEKLEHFILFDSFQSPFTGLASVVVPIRSFHEITGSAVSALGEWRIANGPISGAMGQSLSKILLKVESFLEGAEQSENDLSWEVKRLYLWRLAHPLEQNDSNQGKPESQNSKKELKSGAYWLLVGNDQYHSGSMTLRGAHLAQFLDRSIHVSAFDKDALNISEGENLEVTIGSSNFILPAKFRPDLMKNCCFVPVNAFLPDKRPWFEGFDQPLMVSLRKASK